MPAEQRSPGKADAAASKRTSYGQVIEYIRDRLYLASYTHAPTSSTPFPYPLQTATTAGADAGQKSIAASEETAQALIPVYFSIDKYLRYQKFHADFGPLHIGHTYRFSCLLHEVLAVSEKEGRPIVFWTRADSKSRANAACILACYMVLVQHWPPHLALAPIAQMDPPLMPFRDAGYSQADYILNIQDIVYGVWRAKEEGICDFKSFNIQEYEAFERVNMGDFNWISPNFVAFASPQHEPIAVIPATSPEFAALPKTIEAVMDDSALPQPFKNVLAHFKARKVGLVIRLNSELYSPSFFAALGIKHLDMIFDDGTCPPLVLVKRFIKLAHEMITIKRRNIAVHCKAGLGRTGCLIGAYLIYRHGFTANEVMAYMRFMRPGMVVGPQQHWLHLNQGTFREWWFEDSMKDKMALLARSTPPRISHRQALNNSQTMTPPNGNVKRRALGEIDDNMKEYSTVTDDSYLPAPTPGQPRKTSKLYGESFNTYTDNENEPIVEPGTEIISIKRHIGVDSESEEELQLRMLARRTSRSPSSSQKQRSASCVTTTTTTTEWNIPASEVMAQTPATKTPLNTRSGNGAGALSVSKRSGTLRKTPGDTRAGVRKTSGRVGSAGASALAVKVKP